LHQVFGYFPLEILSKMNESMRQKKVARLIQKEIGIIFQEDSRYILSNSFVTITDVRITPDLGIARVYVSMMLVDDKEALIDKINNRKSEIRGILGRNIRHQLRIVPDLLFFVDELQDNASQLDTLIDSLDIPPEKEPGTDEKEDD